MDTPDQRRVEQTDERPRRTYERPVIAWEEDFAPYAFSGCGKMAGQGGACLASKMS